MSTELKSAFILSIIVLLFLHFAFGYRAHQRTRQALARNGWRYEESERAASKWRELQNWSTFGITGVAILAIALSS